VHGASAANALHGACTAALHHLHRAQQESAGGLKLVCNTQRA